MRKHSFGHPAEQVGAQALALQKAQKQLDAAVQFVDQALRPVTSWQVSKPAPAAENKKRKRASPFARHDRDFAEQLSLPGTPTADLLPLFKSELRSYQLQGIKWLYAMFTNGLHSVLADERSEDRKVQVAGLLSCLRSKGTCGPILLVAPASSHQPWTSDLSRMLGADGVVMHVMSGGPAGMGRAADALAAFCRTAGNVVGTRSVDPSSVAPTSIVLCTPQAMSAHHQLLAQLAFKFVILDLVQSDSSSDGGRDTSPCVSHVGSPAEHHHHSAAPAHHTRRHSMSFPDAGPSSAPLRGGRASAPSQFAGGSLPHGLPSSGSFPQCNLSAPSQPRLGSSSGAAAGAATRTQAARRHSGPITRSASVGGFNAASSSLYVDDDPGHAQLVLSLSRLSSSGGAHEDEGTSCMGSGVGRGGGGAGSGGGVGSDGGGVGAASGAAARPPPLPLRGSGGTATAGPFAAANSTAASLQPPPLPAAGAAACLRPPRPASLRSLGGSGGSVAATAGPTGLLQPAQPPMLASASSWPLNLSSTMGGGGGSQQQQLSAGGGSGSLHAPMHLLGITGQEQLLQQQQHRPAAPLTRKRSMSAAALADSVAFLPLGMAAAAESGSDQLLSFRQVQALRTIRPGPGGVLLLADSPVIEDVVGEELWAVVALLLPALAPQLMACVEEAMQAAGTSSSQSAALLDQVRALTVRFALQRGSGSTSLDSLRGQGPECNLYDLFACAD